MHPLTLEWAQKAEADMLRPIGFGRHRRRYMMRSVSMLNNVSKSIERLGFKKPTRPSLGLMIWKSC